MIANAHAIQLGSCFDLRKLDQAEIQQMEKRPEPGIEEVGDHAQEEDARSTLMRKEAEEQETRDPETGKMIRGELGVGEEFSPEVATEEEQQEK